LPRQLAKQLHRVRCQRAHHRAQRSARVGKDEIRSKLQQRNGDEGSLHDVRMRKRQLVRGHHFVPVDDEVEIYRPRSKAVGRPLSTQGLLDLPQPFFYLERPKSVPHLDDAVEEGRVCRPLQSGRAVEGGDRADSQLTLEQAHRPLHICLGIDVGAQRDKYTRHWINLAPDLSRRPRCVRTSARPVSPPSPVPAERRGATGSFVPPPRRAPPPSGTGSPPLPKEWRISRSDSQPCPRRGRICLPWPG